MQSWMHSWCCCQVWYTRQHYHYRSAHPTSEVQYHQYGLIIITTIYSSLYCGGIVVVVVVVMVLLLSFMFTMIYKGLNCVNNHSTKKSECIHASLRQRGEWLLPYTQAVTWVSVNAARQQYYLFWVENVLCIHAFWSFV